MNSEKNNIKIENKGESKYNQKFSHEWFLYPKQIKKENYGAFSLRGSIQGGYYHPKSNFNYIGVT
jgi:hypothetical protein